jgi:excisionase family DNA binding protein
MLAELFSRDWIIVAAVASLNDQLFGPREEEAEGLASLRDQMEAIAAAQTFARLIGPDGETVEVPASAFEALRFVVQGMAAGKTMTLMPHGKELTTQEAAEILHVSRPHLIKLLDRNEIAFHRTPGLHRRIRIEDVLEFRARRAVERREHLRALTEFSQSLELEH